MEYWFLYRSEILLLNFDISWTKKKQLQKLRGSSFAIDTYWSSTELNDISACVQDLSNGSKFFELKDL